MKIQKRLAGQLLNASPKRIKFDNERLADINEAITKTDVRKLIDEKAIKKVQEKGVSRGRARKTKTQKSKGKQKGKGSRAGKSTARLPGKQAWMNKIRSQRELLRTLREGGLISQSTFRDLYKKAKGGYFRSQRHIKLYVGEKGLIIKQEATKPSTGTSKAKPEVKKKTLKKTTDKPKKATNKKSE